MSLNAGSHRAADPDFIADLFHVNPPCPAHAQALADAVASRCQPGAQQPLGDAGIEAAGGRVFGHAITGDKGPYLELRVAVITLGVTLSLIHI